MLLIFDFDGTIVDTKSLYYNAIYNSVKRFGYKYEDVDRIIDRGANLKKSLKMLGLKPLMILIMKRKVMKEVKKQIPTVHKCRDVDSIKELKQDKILVTNSLKSAVIPLLKHFRLKKEFREVYGFEDFTDKGKFLKDYIKERKLNSEKVYYIGDRAADVKVAKKAKCKSVIITGKCAWDSAAEIIEQEPDYIIHSIKDLKEIL
jgi:phosphoglycolate phosphatase-like HAD superfamily hydrolase